MKRKRAETEHKEKKPFGERFWQRLLGLTRSFVRGETEVQRIDRVKVFRVVHIFCCVCNLGGNTELFVP